MTTYYDLTELYPRLRIRIGDITPATYRYTDADTWASSYGTIPEIDL